MGDHAEQHQNWWQKNKKLLMRTVLIALLVVVIVLIILIILGYIFNWDWTGLTATDFKSQKTTNIIVYQPGKTLWDWLGLLGVLAIPVVVGFGVAWFTAQQAQESEANRQRQDKESELNRDRRHKTDIEIAEDQQKENALQTYLDSMSDLLLNHGLRLSQPGDEVRQVARERTLIALRRLNAARNKIVVQFLQDAGLLSGENIVIDFINANLENDDLSNANLSYANLSNTNLSNTHLDGADLINATLSYANLSNAHLDGANLSGASIDRANLSGTTLIGTNLSGAFMNYTTLSGADLSGADLTEVYPMHSDLSGARYTTKQMQITGQHGKLITLQPTRWRQGFDYKAAGTVCVDC
jgi:hypothetical protein